MVISVYHIIPNKILLSYLIIGLSPLENKKCHNFRYYNQHCWKNMFTCSKLFGQNSNISHSNTLTLLSSALYKFLSPLFPFPFPITSSLPLTTQPFPFFYSLPLPPDFLRVGVFPFLPGQWVPCHAVSAEIRLFTLPYIDSYTRTCDKGAHWCKRQR